MHRRQEATGVTDPDSVAGEPATTEVGTDVTSADVDVEELRRQLDEAAPRLEAFAQLEALAEAQNTTPEAMATQASIDVLKVEEAERRAELQELEDCIDRLRSDTQQHVEERDMLIKQQDELRDEIVIVLDEHTSIVDQMAEMIDELESIRADAVRLLGEKASLELKVEALRNEVAALGGDVARRSELESELLVDDDEASAFDKFFEAEVVEDKARAWMLE
jgi:DNA repair exonuclease SbcCD ATPase subunit